MNPILTKVLGSLSGDLMGSVGKVIDNLNLSAEEKADITQKITNETNRHIEALDTSELEMFKAAVDDTKSARQREVDVANSGAGWLSKNIGSVLALLYTGIFITVITTALTHTVKANDTITSSIITGTFGIVMLILGYYFGSSKTNTKQQETMNTMVNNLTK